MHRAQGRAFQGKGNSRMKPLQWKGASQTLGARRSVQLEPRSPEADTGCKSGSSARGMEGRGWRRQKGSSDAGGPVFIPVVTISVRASNCFLDFLLLGHLSKIRVCSRPPLSLPLALLCVYPDHNCSARRANLSSSGPLCHRPLPPLLPHFP